MSNIRPFQRKIRTVRDLRQALFLFPDDAAISIVDAHTGWLLDVVAVSQDHDTIKKANNSFEPGDDIPENTVMIGTNYKDFSQ